MKITIQLLSDNLTKEELAVLLQAIRDHEQRNFPDKDLMILVDVPYMVSDEMLQLASNLKPPFVFQKRFGWPGQG